MNLPSTYKGLMEKTYTWVEAREIATNGASNDRRGSFERSKKSSWDNNRGRRNKDRFFIYQGPNHGLLPINKKFTTTHLAVHNIKQREGESTRAFIIGYTDDTLQILGLHEEKRISGFVHCLRTRSLVEHLSTNLPSTYKGLMEKTYTWVEARERAKKQRQILPLSRTQSRFASQSVKKSKGNSRHEKGCSQPRFSLYQGPNHGLLPSLSKSPKEILATKKAARSFEPPPKMFESKRLRDMSKYCHFHDDYGHDTNDFRHLRTQIQKAVNLGQLSHLVKGIKKEKTKLSDIPRGESRKDKGKAPAETPILMVRLPTQYAVRKNSDAKDGNPSLNDS
nr:hypothetical protein [Tanacetum cinerariifolium]